MGSNLHSGGKTMKFRIGNQKGQGMVEYIIIIALVAIAAIAAFKFFGRTVRDQTAGVTQELAGQSGADSITDAQTAAGKASDAAKTETNLGTYSGQNEQ